MSGGYEKNAPVISGDPVVPCCPESNAPKAARRRLRSTANGLGVMLFFSGIGSSSFSLFLFLMFKWLGYMGSARYTATAYMDPVLYYLLVSTVYCISFLLPGLLYLGLTKMPLGRVFPTQKLRPDLFAALFFFGAALALLANVPVNWLGDLLQQFFPAGAPEPPASATTIIFTEPLSWVAQTLSVLRTALLPAFFEEFLFRGILMGQLRRWGDGFAIFFSALLFGLFHGSWTQIPFAFLVGLALGYLVVRTNNIWVSVAVHCFNNTFSAVQGVIRPLVSVGDYNFMYHLVFFGTIFLGGLAALYLFWRWRGFYRLQPRHRIPMALPVRVLTWAAAPGTVLVVAYCIFSVVTGWI